MKKTIVISLTILICTLNVDAQLKSSQNIFPCNTDTIETSILEDSNVPHNSIIYKLHNDTIYLKLKTDTVGFQSNDSLFVLNEGIYRFLKYGSYPNWGYGKVFYVRDINQYSNLQNFEFLCDTCQLELKIKDVFSSYLWSTTDTNNSINTSDAGMYWVQSNSHCGNSYLDTIILTSNYDNQFYCGEKENPLFTHVDFDSIVEMSVMGTSLEYYLDLNNDSVDDYKFFIANSASHAHISHYISIIPLNGNQVAIADSTSWHNFLYYGSPVPPYYYKNLEPLSQFELVNENLKWYNQEALLYRNYIVNYESTPPLYSSAGYFKDTTSYVGLKLLEDSTPTYVWLRFKIKVFYGPYVTIDLINYSISKEISFDVEEVEIKGPINVYPNPTLGISYFDIDSFIFVEIFNKTGQFIDKSFDNKIDLTNYPKGIYFIRVVAKNKIYTGKIVKL